MSFSSETKNELARVKDIDVNDKQAELSAIVECLELYNLLDFAK